MFSKPLRIALYLSATTLVLLLAGCGGNSSPVVNNGSGSGNGGAPQGQGAQNGTVSVVISDDPLEDWATIGVKVLSISLTPQSGTPVTVYTAPNPVPIFNLAQLNQLGELLQNAPTPQGTYTGATLTLSANPGDVSLIASADPEAGFAALPGSTIPSNQIQIVGAQGVVGSLTVPLNVNFSSPLRVNANQNSAMNLEFDLAHPAFIIAHTLGSASTTLWAVDFNPAFRNHPIDDITRLVLRHLFGTVNAVATDNSSITVTRDFPVEPLTSPETAIVSSHSLQILADGVNGTIFNDLDAKTTTTIKNFSAQAGSLVSKFVRVAARFQPDGSLVAVRVWTSSTFQRVFVNPEGSVLHINTSTDVLTILNEQGIAIPVTVNSSTQFFFRTPSNATADAAPIGVGTAFLGNLVRGFKVHVNVVDPLATPLAAQTVDIETAAFSGTISAPTTTSFTDIRNFHTVTDNYTINLDFVAGATPNGKDANGNPILGFKWSNFTFPTVIDSGATAIPDFITATGGLVNFGGTVAPIQAAGSTYAVWNNSANPNHFSALSTVLTPIPMPLGTVAANWVTTGTGGTFSISVLNGGATPVTVNANSVSGSATLVFQVDRTNGAVTVSPLDITTAAGLTAVTTNLVSPTPVKVFGVPQADGSIEAFVILFFTGTKPVA